MLGGNWPLFNGNFHFQCESLVIGFPFRFMHAGAAIIADSKEKIVFSPNACYSLITVWKHVQRALSNSPHSRYQAEHSPLLLQEIFSSHIARVLFIWKLNLAMSTSQVDDSSVITLLMTYSL